jgi:hypothetical protein
VDEIGTLAWTRRTRGRMSAREGMAFLARGIGTLLAVLPDRTLAALGVRRDRLARLDLDSLKLPDSAAASEAEAVAGELPPWLWHHSQRSYIWAVALAQVDGLKGYDEECLYVGCLLHDAGLPPAVASHADACFTLGGADLAGRCARAGGWPDERRERLCESITLHVNPSVPPEQSLEGHLLSAGSTLDGVALRRYWDMDPAFVSTVLERHPRLGIKRELLPMLRAHARDAPRSRIGFMWRYASLGTLISRSPFDE